MMLQSYSVKLWLTVNYWVKITASWFVYSGEHCKLYTFSLHFLFCCTMMQGKVPKSFAFTFLHPLTYLNSPLEFCGIYIACFRPWQINYPVIDYTASWFVYSGEHCKIYTFTCSFRNLWGDQGLPCNRFIKIRCKWTLLLPDCSFRIYSTIVEFAMRNETTVNDRARMMIIYCLGPCSIIIQNKNQEQEE